MTYERCQRAVMRGQLIFARVVKRGFLRVGTYSPGHLTETCPVLDSE